MSHEEDELGPRFMAMLKVGEAANRGSEMLTQRADEAAAEDNREKWVINISAALALSTLAMEIGDTMAMDEGFDPFHGKPT